MGGHLSAPDPTVRAQAEGYRTQVVEYRAKMNEAKTQQEEYLCSRCEMGPVLAAVNPCMAIADTTPNTPKPGQTLSIIVL